MRSIHRILASIMTQYHHGEGCTPQSAQFDAGEIER